jgi:hypothetical protein
VRDGTGNATTQGGLPHKRRRQGNKGKKVQGARTMANHRMTYQQWLESSGCCGLQDARQQRRGGARAEVTHRTQAKQRGGQVTTKGHRKIHPPPSPSHVGTAPGAETAAVLATEPGGHTTHGEEREDGKPLPRQHPTHGKAREREAGSKQRNAGLAHLRQPGDQRIGGTVPWGQKGARPTSAQDTQRKAEQARTHNHTHRPRLRTVQRRLGSPPRAGLTGVHRSKHACKQCMRVK